MPVTRPAMITGRRATTVPEPPAGWLRAAAETGWPAGLAPGLRAEGEGWHPAAELAAPPYGRLGRMVEETGRRWDAPPHVAAALWWKGFSYWTTLPVAMSWATERRVPLMTARNTMLRPLPDEPRLQVALNAPAAGGGDAGDGELGALIRETLLEDLHAPLIEALHALTRAGRRGLWGSVAEALVHPLISYAGDLLDDPAGQALTLLRSVGGPVAGLMELPALRRRTCCLWVTLPGREACSTCCVTACDRPGT
ncbi:hypothetical protein GCM10017673_46040 [Streptosporangium violaceochromogenes]|nr:hypothetical protein GCM10017673_46040 [Streptosporangium violaceochromogenes]